MADYDMRAFGRMNAGDRKVALGFDPNAHLPQFFTGVVVVHGIKLFLETKGAVRGYKRQRVRAACPVCNKVFAAGNLAQHHMIHTKEGRHRLAAKAKFARERNARWRQRRRGEGTTT